MSIAVFCLAALCAPPAAAATAPPTFALFSEPGDWAGYGQPWHFEGSQNVKVQEPFGSLWVEGTDSDWEHSFSIQMTPPEGEELAEGAYPDAESSPSEGRPGLRVGGRGCNVVDGSFEIRELERGAAGEITKLWVLFEQRCEADPLDASFGEVRIGMPQPSGPLRATPSTVRWPGRDLQATSGEVPLRVTPTGAGPVALGQAKVTGSAAGDFPVVSDDCSGRTLPGGHSCTVRLSFAPKAAGTRRAALSVPGGGAGVQVPLEGYGHGGMTAWRMHSEPGDYVGYGRDYDYTPANARIAAMASPYGGVTRLGFGLVGRENGDWFDAFFSPPPGEELEVGETYVWAGGSGPTMDIYGNGHACSGGGRFTVVALSLDHIGRVRHAGIDFERRCDGSEGSLRGSLRYRVPAGERGPAGPASVSRAGSGTSTPPAAGSRRSAIGPAPVRLRRPRAVASRNGSALLEVRAPGAGRLVASSIATPAGGRAGEARRVRYRRVTMLVKRARRVRMHIRPGRRALRLLRRRSLSVRAKVTFIPVSGSPASHLVRFRVPRHR